MNNSSLLETFNFDGNHKDFGILTVLHNTCMAQMLNGCIKELTSSRHAVLYVKHNLAGQLLAGAQMIRVETELLVLSLHGGACLL